MQCFQNTKSGFGRVVIPDVSSICIASLEEEDYFESWGWDKWNNDDYDPTFKLIDVGPWKPQIILKGDLLIMILPNSRLQLMLKNGMQIVVKGTLSFVRSR